MHSKSERIVAMIGVLLLLALYAVSFVLGVTSNENTFGLFIASVVATIFIPTIIYIYQMFYRLSHKNPDEQEEDSSEDNQ